MKLKLWQKFVTLKGEEVKIENSPALLGPVLANIILTPHRDKKGFRPLKAWELAKKLDVATEIELDLSDVIQIKELVEENDQYFPFIKAQIEEYFIIAEQEQKIDKK